MDTTTEIAQLIQFRNALHQFFDNRANTLMDLVDALSSNVTAQSVVQLSLNSLFRPSYSTLFKSIADYFKPENAEASADERRQQEQKIMRLIMPHLPHPEKQNFWVLGVDVTPWKRQFAQTLSDRGYVYYPNAIKGNKPVTIGHQFSLLALLPEKAGMYAPAWLLPLSLRRIGTDEDKEMVGAEQVDMLMEDPQSPIGDDLVLLAADTAYSKPRYLHANGKHDNLVTIARARSNRVLYRVFVPDDDAPNPQAHPTWFGDRFALQDASTWHEVDEEVWTEHTSRRGKKYDVQLECWEEMSMRGKRDVPMHKHPFTLVRVRLFDEDGNLAFKRPMWLLVVGKRRTKPTLLEIYKTYRQRYDVEHFFRFGKQRLLMDKFQTPEVDREESWAHLVMLSYVQLWLAHTIAERWPYPWERYLPAVKTAVDTTPSLVQRDFERIIREIGTPAGAPKPNINDVGREKGMKLPKRPRKPVVYKGKKEAKSPP